MPFPKPLCQTQLVKLLEQADLNNTEKCSNIEKVALLLCTRQDSRCCFLSSKLGTSTGDKNILVLLVFCL